MSEGYIICGLGRDGKIAIKYLKDNNKHIIRIADSDTTKLGRSYEEIIIGDYSFTYDERENVTFVIGAISCLNEIKNTLGFMGVKHIITIDDLALENSYPEINSLPTSDNPEVSIILPCYNLWEYTYNCLKSIAAHKTNIRYELILADDHSSDETINAENMVSGIRVLHNKRNLNYLMNCNNAVSYARGQYIYLFGSDQEVIQDYWLESMLEGVNIDHVAAVSCKCLHPFDLMSSIGTSYIYGKTGNLYQLPDVDNRYSQFLLVANTMIRKDVWNLVGGYSEEFKPTFYDDNDLCLKILKMGYDLSYISDGAKIIHYKSRTVLRNRSVAEVARKNATIFWNKWKNYIIDFGWDENKIHNYNLKLVQSNEVNQ